MEDVMKHLSNQTKPAPIVLAICLVSALIWYLMLERKQPMPIALTAPADRRQEMDRLAMEQINGFLREFFLHGGGADRPAARGR